MLGEQGSDGFNGGIEGRAFQRRDGEFPEKQELSTPEATPENDIEKGIADLEKRLNELRDGALAALDQVEKNITGEIATALLRIRVLGQKVAAQTGLVLPLKDVPNYP